MITMLNDKSYFVGRDKDGKEHFRATLISDTCEELVGVTTLKDGKNILDFGSIAICGKAGEICMLMSDSKWYKQSNGQEVTV